MADYNARIAPFINDVFYVTSIFGIQETRVHRGLDIATVSEPRSDTFIFYGKLGSNS